ncbi:Phosphoribosylformylglycinamidine synthase subunit PurL, partial [Bienertia sinuspersici]
MFEVHARKFEDRVAIYCNDKGQPIGPKKARNELTRFLGTIAHDYNWAPLTYTNWQKVPDKDKIWEYVNSKYILPPESYDWVMETLDVSWRGFKCRLKRDHYYPYDTYEKRLNSRPNNVPEDHFKLLLKYWASTPAKKTSLQNAKNRQQQDNMHTCGPVAFAMISDEMFRQDGEVPSKRKLFERTRSRKEGKTYAKPFDDTQTKIQEMRRLEALEADESSECQKDPFDEVMGDGRAVRKRLVGIGVSRKKPQENVAGNSLILPKEVMESIKIAVVADVQKELSAEREEIAKEKEAHAARVAEMERATKEQEMRDDLATQKEPMTLDVIASALAQLRQKDPSLTSEMIAKVIVESAT